MFGRFFVTPFVTRRVPFRCSRCPTVAERFKQRRLDGHSKYGEQIRGETTMAQVRMFALLAAVVAFSATSTNAQQISVTSSAFLDSVYDYEVWSARSTEGKTEFVILARFSDGQWDFVHKYEFQGTPDHGGSMVNRGVHKFTTHYSATRKANKLIDAGEIIDYTIIEQDVQPQWVYEDTFPTRAQAEDYADLVEAFSIQFGDPHITKIVPVMSNISMNRLRR